MIRSSLQNLSLLRKACGDSSVHEAIMHLPGLAQMCLSNMTPTGYTKH